MAFMIILEYDSLGRRLRRVVRGESPPAVGEMEAPVVVEGKVVDEEGINAATVDPNIDSNPPPVGAVVGPCPPVTYDEVEVEDAVLATP